MRHCKRHKLFMCTGHVAGSRVTPEALALPAALPHRDPSKLHQDQQELESEARKPSAAKPKGSGIFGSLSRAANLVLYVAGSPAAVERRAREMGHRTAGL